MGSCLRRLGRRGWPCSAVLESKESLYPYSDEGGIYYLLHVDPIKILLRTGVGSLPGFLVMGSSLFLVEDQGGMRSRPQVVDPVGVRVI